MKVYKNLWVLLLCLAIGALVVKTTTPESRSQTTPRAQDVKPDLNKFFEEFPIVDLNAPEPSDPDERARRRARNKRYDNTDRDAETTKLFMFQEGTGAVSLGAPSAHSPVEPAFPITQSSVIAIGEVTDARAQISNDKTNVFSEFTVLIKDIYKNTASASLVPDCAITVERYGGRVRLPSGKIIVRGFLHQSMPQTGRRYIFFLKSNEEVKTYSIITGYELRGGQVIPLDGSRMIEGEGIPQLREYDRYRGANETTFLKEIKDAIASSLQNISTGGVHMNNNNSRKGLLLLFVGIFSCASFLTTNTTTVEVKAQQDSAERCIPLPKTPDEPSAPMNAGECARPGTTQLAMPGRKMRVSQ